MKKISILFILGLGFFLISFGFSYRPDVQEVTTPEFFIQLFDSTISILVGFIFMATAPILSEINSKI